MKAITLWQPYASLVAIGAKQNETRSWATKYRGPLAIHAAMNMPKWVKKLLPGFARLIGIKEYNGSWLYYLEHGSGPFGKVVAIGNLVDCVPITPEFVANLSEQEKAFGDYTPGRFAWILEDVRRFEKPVPAKGMQGLWNWDETQADGIKRIYA